MYGNPNFGQWIKQRRIALSLTHRLLAEQLACSVSLLRKYESGERRPPLPVATRLADLLAIPAAQRAAFLDLARDTSEQPNEQQPASLRQTPPVRSTQQPPPIPAAPNLLIGRTADVEAICARLLPASTRLLTLLGPPGVGKTRLAQHIAAALWPIFDEQVAYVELAPLVQASQALSALAQVLELTEQASVPLLIQLIEHLRSRRALLVLDNFEHLLPAAPLIADLLAACPQIKVLCTSRAALRIRAERVFAVQPLALPPLMAETEKHDRGKLQPKHTPSPALSPSPISANVIAASSAVQLFLDRAQALVPDFALDETNAAGVARICVRLDGLPLALELAAARIEQLAPADLLDQLARRLLLLNDGPRDLPARQQTLRDAIAWSYDLLTNEEQTLFARLGVFVGGFTLEAARVIADGGWQALHCNADRHDHRSSTIDHLHAKSLIQRTELVDGQERFTLLETLREFALERLEARGELAELRHRHAAYYADLAERAEPELRAMAAARWIKHLDAELNNIRAAMQWSLEHDGGVIAARITAALTVFWQVRGYFSEGRRWVEPLLHVDPTAWYTAITEVTKKSDLWSRGGKPFVYHLESFPALVTAAPDAPDRDPAAWPPLLLARVTYTLGFLASQQNGMACYPLLEQSVALYRELDDWRGLARALNALGMLFRWPGCFSRARALFEESLALQRRHGERDTLGPTLDQIGLMELEQGHAAVAERAFREAIDVDRALGRPGAVLRYLPDLAEAALRQGETTRAESLYTEALGMARAHGDREVVAEALHGLGVIAMQQQDAARAQTCYEESLAIYRDMGLNSILIRLLRDMGYLALAQGDHRLATERFQESLRIAIAPGQIETIVHDLWGMALVAGAQERHAQAARLFGAAAVFAQEFDLRDTPYLRIPAEQGIIAGRLALGSAAWEAAWSAGSMLTSMQAIAEALAL